MDQDEIVADRVEAMQTIQRALVTRLPTGDHLRRRGHSGSVQDALSLIDPSGMRHDDELIDTCGGDSADAAQQDLLTCQAEELLWHVGAKADPVASGEDYRVDAHRRGGRGWDAIRLIILVGVEILSA